MIKCYTCRDKGLLEGCPDCGKVLDIFNISKSPDLISKQTSIFIPEFYRGKEWNFNRAIINRPGVVNNSASIKFFAELEVLHNGIKDNKKLSNSAIVTAPAGFSKSVWVYSCLQSLILHSEKVAPYISTSEYLRLYNMDVNKPYMNYKYLEHTIQDYNEAELLFVEIPDDEAFLYAYETVLKILNIRAKFDKPTVFVSNIPVAKIIARDINGTLLKYLTNEDTGNPYKYLVSISYSEVNIGRSDKDSELK